MRTSGEFISPKWLRIFQIVVGAVCVAISIAIIVNIAMSRFSNIGLYSLIFVASIAFIIIGIERIVVGVKTTSLKRSSRIISIVIGAGIVGYFGSGYFFPDFMTKLYVLILGLGLLAIGALRVIDGLRNNTYERSSKIFTLFTGGLCVVGAIIVFLFPTTGFILLMLIVSIIFFINGIQIAFVGLTGKKIARASL